MSLPYTFTNGTTANADEVMSNLKYAAIQPWYKISAYNANISNGLLNFGSSVLQSENRRSTDAGVTWSGSGYTANYVATNSGAAGCGIVYNSNTSKYTTDSGATWSAATTAPANMTACLCIAMGSTTVAVTGGTMGVGKSIWYSTDGGNNWTVCATGPAFGVDEGTYGICMASATVGYAIDSVKKIWKTTDGGVNWTDTTHVSTLPGAMSTTDGARMFAVDTDTCLIMHVTNFIYVEKYVNSTGTITALLRMDIPAVQTSNIVKATNGNCYCCADLSVVSGANYVTHLFFIKYDGTNTWVKSVGPVTYGAMFAVGTVGINSMIQPSTNYLKVNIANQILDIDVAES